MTFEEWYSVHQADCWALVKENGTRVALKAAWEAGVQEGINRMYLLYDICPECRVTGGRHQMDCGRGR